MAFVMQCVKHFNGISIGEDRRILPQPPWEQFPLRWVVGWRQFFVELDAVPAEENGRAGRPPTSLQLSKKKVAGRPARSDPFIIPPTKYLNS